MSPRFPVSPALIPPSCRRSPRRRTMKRSFARATLCLNRPRVRCGLCDAAAAEEDRQDRMRVRSGGGLPMRYLRGAAVCAVLCVAFVLPPVERGFGAPAATIVIGNSSEFVNPDPAYNTFLNDLN